MTQKLSHGIINCHAIEADHLEVGFVDFLVEGLRTAEILSHFLLLQPYLLHLRLDLFVLADEHGDVVGCHLLVLEVVLSQIVDTSLGFFIK